MAVDLGVFGARDASRHGTLDPELAGEGIKVLMSDGSEGVQSILPPKSTFPDWSEIKQLKKYFGPKAYRPFPTWIYHPTEEPIVVQSAEEAAKYGVIYRAATVEERGMYGIDRVWAWADGSQWRARPYDKGKRTLDPDRMEHGKIYVEKTVSAQQANASLLRELLPQIAEIMARSAPQAAAAPASVNPKEWAEFQQFKAWQAAQLVANEVMKLPEETIDEPSEEIYPDAEPKVHEAYDPGIGSGVLARYVEGSSIGTVLNTIANLADDELAASAAAESHSELDQWRKEAEAIGIKVDKRWSLKTLEKKIAEVAAQK